MKSCIFFTHLIKNVFETDSSARASLGLLFITSYIYYSYLSFKCVICLNLE